MFFCFSLCLSLHQSHSFIFLFIVLSNLSFIFLIFSLFLFPSTFLLSRSLVLPHSFFHIFSLSLTHTHTHAHTHISRSFIQFFSVSISGQLEVENRSIQTFSFCQHEKLKKNFSFETFDQSSRIQNFFLRRLCCERIS